MKEQQKQRTLLHHVGCETFSLLQTYFHPEHLWSVAYKRIIAYLNGYYIRRKAYMLKRKQFYALKQREREDFKSYVIELKNLAKTCDFGKEQEYRIRDHFVLGLNNPKVQHDIFKSYIYPLQSLDDVVDSAMALETTESEDNPEPSESVLKVTREPERNRISEENRVI
ncbi:hypothetical protein RF11_11294 [Thelohanellus kitauei]|uniref:Retrotransposon gag domain-containing protein n=1 Tax=Thelohanellus kitauei TaxID=669202 RepID=A0A0C2MA59_THEKT|nr:hypothetical protein RF11_11294 [Thelohanellus kitauei]